MGTIPNAIAISHEAKMAIFHWVVEAVRADKGSAMVLNKQKKFTESFRNTRIA